MVVGQKMQTNFTVKMKKFIALFLVFAFALTLGACGKKDIVDTDSSKPTSSETSSEFAQDDADDMTSSELDEVAKDFVDNANPSIIVTPNSSDAGSSNPSSSDSGSSTGSSGGDSSADTSSDTTSSASKPSTTVSGWTPYL